MPKTCSAGDCLNHSLLYDKVTGKALHSFYQFPSNQKYPERRLAWARACQRKDPKTDKLWVPKPEVRHVYVCSDHFVTGKQTYSIQTMCNLLFPLPIWFLLYIFWIRVMQKRKNEGFFFFYIFFLFYFIYPLVFFANLPFSFLWSLISDLQFRKKYKQVKMKSWGWFNTEMLFW